MDPYRTPAVVETDEQRLQRLRNTYYAMGMCDPRHLPSERRDVFEKQYREAERRYFDAARNAARNAPIPHGPYVGPGLLEILGLKEMK